MIRSYSELQKLNTFEERYDYLNLNGTVGDPTFGFDRYLNQNFYTSAQWRHLRHFVISRDLGCDLGVIGDEIPSRLVVHHMNPMRKQDLIDGDDVILDPEFLISTAFRTHNAIHYGDRRYLPPRYAPRQPQDTRLW
jgi:hypothetical protein